MYCENSNWLTFIMNRFPVSSFNQFQIHEIQKYFMNNIKTLNPLYVTWKLNSGKVISNIEF